MVPCPDRHALLVKHSRNVVRVRRAGNELVAELRNAYTEALVERRVDTVVAEHGVRSRDALYLELVADSRNRGELDLDAFVAGAPQGVVANPRGRFRLFRIGDALAGRDVAAAVYDALRLCKEL